jgi:hypothetical protein
LEQESGRFGIVELSIMAPSLELVFLNILDGDAQKAQMAAVSERTVLRSTNGKSSSESGDEGTSLNPARSALKHGRGNGRTVVDGSGSRSGGVVPLVTAVAANTNVVVGDDVALLGGRDNDDVGREIQATCSKSGDEHEEHDEENHELWHIGAVGAITRQRPHVSWRAMARRQAKALLRKRMLCARRDLWTTISHLLLPALVTAFAMLTIRSVLTLRRRHAVTPVTPVGHAW